MSRSDPKLVVHIGAHRTGTTSLQRLLKKNKKNLLNQGIQCITPPETRQGQLSSTFHTSPTVIVSEENLLGTMESNFWAAQLYPDASSKLLQNNELIENADVIFLSIRSYVDWWGSALSFLIRKGFGVPTNVQIGKVATSDRGWPEVVSEIQSTAKNAEIVVREFSWKIGNPKQQLRKVTGLKVFDGIPAEKSPHNVRPSVSTLASILAEREDYADVLSLPDTEYYQPFTASQVEEMDERYLTDLSTLASRPNVRLLCDFELAEAKLKEDRKIALDTSTGDYLKRTAKTCFIHIGKTGGTYFKSQVDGSGPEDKEIFLGSHGDTLLSTIGKFGRHRKVAFFFRDPAERFVSGFLSRLRQGRPIYNVNWTPGEAISFLYFEDPNRLAEALYSDNERDKSSARFAFSQIFHLKHNYAHYLTSKKLLENELRLGNILVCCETKRLDSQRNKILNRLGISDYTILTEVKNQRPSQDEIVLTPLAQKNLQEFWAIEYEIYRTCLSISQELGFS